MMATNTVIAGFGSYIPEKELKNEDFLNHEFYDEKGEKLPYDNATIISKFNAITGIEARRYAKDDEVNSDLGTKAALDVFKKTGIDPETIDYIIYAQNFGDLSHNGDQADMMPSLASRVKHNLKIKNPNCVAYDMIFGCPGWVESLIQANMFIKAGEAKRCLVIGGETLSRTVDKHDRDAMIYADGAGACILEASQQSENGILAHASQSFTYDEAHFLYYGKTYKSASEDKTKYIKMFGRKIYEFALNNVPNAMQLALDKSGYTIDDVKKIFIHQANEKMDEQIVRRFYRLHKMQMPEGIMPMSIHKLGNSSVATVPTLIDSVQQGLLENQEINKGDIAIFASVGAGMNINAVVYKF
jgi:3-oxoacyl-[acyl-carrier-protein] synthase-3